MKLTQMGRIKHNAKKTGNDRDAKLSKSDRKKIKAIRRFKRNNSL